MKHYQTFVAVACVMSSASFVHATPVPIHGAISRTDTNTENAASIDLSSSSFASPYDTAGHNFSKTASEGTNPVILPRSFKKQQSQGQSAQVPNQDADEDTESVTGIHILRARASSWDNGGNDDGTGRDARRRPNAQETPPDWQVAEDFATHLESLRDAPNYAAVNSNNNGTPRTPDGGDSSDDVERQENTFTTNARHGKRRQTTPFGWSPPPAWDWDGSGNDNGQRQRSPFDMNGGREQDMDDERRRRAQAADKRARKELIRGRKRSSRQPQPPPSSPPSFLRTSSSTPPSIDPAGYNRRDTKPSRDRSGRNLRGLSSPTPEFWGARNPTSFSSDHATSSRQSTRSPSGSDEEFEPIDMFNFPGSLDEALSLIDSGLRVTNLQVAPSRDEIRFNGRWVPFPRGHRSIHDYTPWNLGDQLVYPERSLEPIDMRNYPGSLAQALHEMDIGRPVENLQVWSGRQISDSGGRAQNQQVGSEPAIRFNGNWVPLPPGWYPTKYKRVNRVI